MSRKATVIDPRPLTIAVNGGVPARLKAAAAQVDDVRVTARHGSAAGDGGDIVLGWVLRLALVLLLLGVLGYDALSIGTTRMDAADLATRSAIAASDSWNAHHDIRMAYAAAEAVAEGSGASVLPDSFAIDADGTVHVTVREKAHTLLVQRIGPIRSWAWAQVNGQGRSLA